MPEMFGTHHSKMLILIRHDDTAQVIIHTANMIARDWTNMTQAVWKSPLLPLMGTTTSTTESEISPQREQQQQHHKHPVGSGQKFKVDLLNYLDAYNQRRPVCKPLVAALRRFDFAAVRAALVASVPGRHDVYDEETVETKWGWAALKQALRHVPVQEGGGSEVVIQVSSIATLGPTDAWLRGTLFDALTASKNKTAGTGSSNRREEPSFKIVFPTPDEIRRSLDGYVSGASIHTKIQSAQQAKQLLYLKPMFYHWANDAPEGQGKPVTYPSSSSPPSFNKQMRQQRLYHRPVRTYALKYVFTYDTIPQPRKLTPSPQTALLSGANHADLQADAPPTHEAGRKRAAPHIKTYIRYAGAGTATATTTTNNSNNGNNNKNKSAPTIDWALTTSANLSKQAWGEAVSAAGEVRIASWEIGVLVWPSLFALASADTTTAKARMVGTFQKDVPEISNSSTSSSSSSSNSSNDNNKEEDKDKDKENKTDAADPDDTNPLTVVGLRIPYDFPLQKYGAGEKPWVATARYPEPDWKGQTWGV